LAILTGKQAQPPKAGVLTGVASIRESNDQGTKAGIVTYNKIEPMAKITKIKSMLLLTVAGQFRIYT
jgi:hypothetical protein